MFNNKIFIKYKLRVCKLKVFLKSLQSFFKKYKYCLLDLIVSGNEFHRTSATWVEARPPDVERLSQWEMTKETVGMSKENGQIQFSETEDR